MPGKLLLDETMHEPENSGRRETTQQRITPRIQWAVREAVYIEPDVPGKERHLDDHRTNSTIDDDGHSDSHGSPTCYSNAHRAYGSTS